MAKVSQSCRVLIPSSSGLVSERRGTSSVLNPCVLIPSSSGLVSELHPSLMGYGSHGLNPFFFRAGFGTTRGKQANG